MEAKEETAIVVLHLNFINDPSLFADNYSENNRLLLLYLISPVKVNAQIWNLGSYF